MPKPRGRPKLKRIPKLTLSQAKQMLATKKYAGAWLEYDQKKGTYTLIMENNE